MKPFFFLLTVQKLKHSADIIRMLGNSYKAFRIVRIKKIIVFSALVFKVIHRNAVGLARLRKAKAPAYGNTRQQYNNAYSSYHTVKQCLRRLHFIDLNSFFHKALHPLINTSGLNP